MARLAAIPYSVRPCCFETISDLESDPLKICFQTKLSNDAWEKEITLRITGSTCDAFDTHSKKKQPNWEKKCKSHLNPTNFYSKYTEYGRITETEARQMFADFTKKTENGIPTELFEIKCPYKGASMTIDKAIQQEFRKYLDFSNNGIALKKKHQYYGQVQLSMAAFAISAVKIASDFENCFSPLRNGG